MTALLSPKRSRPRATVVLVAVLTVVGLAPSSPATAAALPPGYRVVSTEALAPGVEHQTLRLDQPAQDVHVARLAPGMAGRLLPVLARDVLTGPSSGPEPTSSMCTRVKCVAAVNGDFFQAPGGPVGAMVVAGELVTTPRIDNIVLRVDGRGQPSIRPGIDWSVGVASADGRQVAAGAVNRALSGEGITLYTRRWGPSTLTDRSATEVALQLPPASSPVLPSGRSAVRVGPAMAGGNASIPAGQVVLSGRGAGARALVDLAERARGSAVMNVDVAGMVSAIGGSPQLLQSGKPAYPTENRDSFTQNRHPRTVVGITSSGEMLLVTVDAGPTSSGLTLLEAARLLAGLGAVHAVNLDGGGSTTFVTGGAVRNLPRDGRERPVASALTVMAGGPPDPATTLLTQVTAVLRDLLQPPK